MEIPASRLQPVVGRFLNTFDVCTPRIAAASRLEFSRGIQSSFKVFVDIMTEATQSGVLETARESTTSDKTKSPMQRGDVSEEAATFSSDASCSSSQEAVPEDEAVNDPNSASEEQAVVEHWHFVLTQLAKQLEYYLSKQNLSKDTYLQTLRNLNDGCVPVTVLCNFAKVKAILLGQDEEVRFHAIVQAASEYSELLKVHSIDTATGKVTEDPTSTSTVWILAVGAINPQEALLVEPGSPVVETTDRCNTIILREVPSHVTEDEVRALFDKEDCPPLESVYCSVGYTWFVSFQTDSRLDLMRILTGILPQKTLGGEVILARLKASTARPVFDMSSPALLAMAPLMPIGGRKKKKRTRSKRKKSKKGAAGKTASKPVGTKLPSFGDADFPDLHEDKKVEWVTPPSRSEYDDDDESKEDDDEGEEFFKSTKAISDSGSTATTTSSSLDSLSKKTLGGYAAAVLKPATATKVTHSSEQKQTLQETRSSLTQQGRETTTVMSLNSSQVQIKPTTSERERSPVVIEAPTWGQGRSFADVLRQEDSRS